MSTKPESGPENSLVSRIKRFYFILMLNSVSASFAAVAEQHKNLDAHWQS